MTMSVKSKATFLNSVYIEQDSRCVWCLWSIVMLPDLFVDQGIKSTTSIDSTQYRWCRQNIAYSQQKNEVEN